MANRDKTQGFGFMYVDITKLLKQRDEVAKMEAKPVMTNNLSTLNFNKDIVDSEMKSPESKPADTRIDREAAIHQIKSNLDRLQALHHKLHAMLEELNKAAVPDKRTKLN